MTQAELAQQLHVTDKAVSRWERGIGLPDINTLEPLADVLGLTLADLMHCHDSRQKDATPPVPLEDFFTMLRRQHTVDWRSVRTALLALSIALALWGIFACPGRLAVHWRTLSDGLLQADGWMSSLVIFPLFAGFEFLSLELWNNFEQTGYYRRWGEVNLFIIHAMSFGTPLTPSDAARAGSSVLFLFWISASMLRSMADPFELNAVFLSVPTREKAKEQSPPALLFCIRINHFSAAMPRAQRRAF